MTAETTQKLGFQKTQMVPSSPALMQDSLAEEAGLQRGVLIVKINNTPVSNAESAGRCSTKARWSRGILLEVQTPQGVIDFVLLKAS